MAAQIQGQGTPGTRNAVRLRHGDGRRAPRGHRRLWISPWTPKPATVLVRAWGGGGGDTMWPTGYVDAASRGVRPRRMRAANRVRRCWSARDADPHGGSPDLMSCRDDRTSFAAFGRGARVRGGLQGSSRTDAATTVVLPQSSGAVRRQERPSSSCRCREKLETAA